MLSPVFIIYREINIPGLGDSGMGVRLSEHKAPCELIGGSRDVVKDGFLEEFTSKNGPQRGGVIFK